MELWQNPTTRIQRLIRLGGHLADAAPFLLFALFCLLQFLAFVRAGIQDPF